MRRIRILRVLGFASVYFFIYIVSAILFTIKMLSDSPSGYLQYYLQDPLRALLTVFTELSGSPLLMLAFSAIIAQSLVLGFLTDWALRILLRKRNDWTK